MMTIPTSLAPTEAPAPSGSAGRVDLWSFPLDRRAIDPSTLSADERIRAARFKFDEHRRAFIVGRSWLRDVVGAYAGLPPGEVRFRYLDRGKPILDAPQSVAFSLAHSETLGVIGIGREEPIGVDVERVRPNVLDRAAAELVLSPAELGLIDRAPHRDRAFLRCWVRKEAYAKALGIGLERDLARITLTVGRGTVDWEGLRIRDVPIDDASICAVATPIESVVRYGGVWHPPALDDES